MPFRCHVIRILPLLFFLLLPDRVGAVALNGLSADSLAFRSSSTVEHLCLDVTDSLNLSTKNSLSDSSFTRSSLSPFSMMRAGRLGHRIELDAVPASILHTNQYLKGGNIEGRTMNHAFTFRAKYAFQLPEQSLLSQIYREAYQGIGVAFHDFNWQMGHPWSVFVFQGARIKKFSRALSLNYEWNLGLTFGWHPFDRQTNPDNRVIGSKVTAYIDADFYLRWRLSRCLDLNAGVSMIHFSNGNTTIPNAGLNVVGGRLSLAYYIHRQDADRVPSRMLPRFHHFWGVDVVLFGAYRSLGYNDNGVPQALPGKFGVGGFSVNPLYHVNYWFSFGPSLDGVYDRSANVEYTPTDSNVEPDVVQPSSVWKQMALGLAARAEFRMPFFCINVGVGRNVLVENGDLKAWYQLLALKLDLSRHLFLHIGYSLHDFRYPNHLMLGAGWHF